MIHNLYHLAGWITLLDGIKRIDAECERRKLSFEDHLKPEVLEKYVTERKEDVLHSLRGMAQERRMTERDLLIDFVTQPIATIVDTVSEYNAAHSIH